MEVEFLSETWFNIGKNIYNQTNGSDEGINRWNEFNKNYVAEEYYITESWAAFSPNINFTFEDWEEHIEEYLENEVEEYLENEVEDEEEEGYCIYDERDGECHRFDTLEELSEEYIVCRIHWDDSRSGIYMDLSEDDWNSSYNEENPLSEDWLNGEPTEEPESRTLPENGTIPEL